MTENGAPIQGFARKAKARAARSEAALLVPLSYSLYAVFALAIHNEGQIVLAQIGRSVLLSFVVPLLLGALLVQAGLHPVRAGILVSLAAIAFFGYGHLYEWARAGPVWLTPWARHRYLGPAVAVLFAVISVAVIRRDPPPRTLLVYLSATGIALLALLILPWLATTGARMASQARLRTIPGSAEARAGSADDLDVYYVLLDGFGRADILQDLYGLDLHGFQDSLHRLGFYTAACSQSNYSQTSLSLASSLNMQYLDALAQAFGPSSRDLSALHEMIVHSQVRSEMEARGYQTVAFETGYPLTDVVDAPIHLAPELSETREESSWLRAVSLNEFEGFLLKTTAARIPLDLYLSRQESSIAILDFAYQHHRQRVEYTLASLPGVAGWDGSYWVFAHVLSPHPPFVFGPRGEAVANPQPYTLQDLGSWDREEYIQRYRDQAQFLSQLILAAVEGILQKAPQNSIIILQGDHGPAAHQIPEDPHGSNFGERMSNLEAVYFPDHDYSRLDPSITPVNLFRVVLSQYFGANLPPLPDRSYYSPGSTPFAWWDVTEDLGQAECLAREANP